MSEPDILTALLGEELSAVVLEPFARLLVARIGTRVVHAEVRAGHSAAIRLSDGSSIAVSLDPEDYVGPEALNLWSRDGSLAVL